jgi:hypothetical protein
MNRRKYILAVIGAIVVSAALAYFYGGSQTPSGQPPLARLTTENLSEVESAFNAVKTDVRLLVLLSPT